MNSSSLRDWELRFCYGYAARSLRTIAAVEEMRHRNWHKDGLLVGAYLEMLT